MAMSEPSRYPVGTTTVDPYSILDNARITIMLLFQTNRH